MYLFSTIQYAVRAQNDIGEVWCRGLVHIDRKEVTEEEYVVKEVDVVRVSFPCFP